MLSKNKIKYLRSLKLNKFRQMYNNFVVEGEKMVLELLKERGLDIEHVVATPDWLQRHLKESKSVAQVILEASPKEMGQISSLKNAPPVMAVLAKLKVIEEPGIIKKELSLYLDRIQNPGNLGTILRIADWFGIPYVFCSPECADLYNPKTLQSTMGAFLRVRVLVKEFSQIINEYPQLPIYGTVLDGTSVFEKKLGDHGIIVVGSEGKGISKEILPFISDPIVIPPHPNGGAESLNAAVATGIVCALFRNR